MTDFTDKPKTSFRSEWVAYVPPAQVKEAADRRAAYHRSREQHWTAEEEKATKDYRESIQVREHDVTGGKQVGVAADVEKADHLSHCKGKRDLHRRQAEEFEQWAAFLAEMHPGRSGQAELHSGQLRLTASDATYFRLGMDGHPRRKRASSPLTSLRLTIEIDQDWIDRYKAEVDATEAGGGSNDDEHDLLHEIAEQVLKAAGQEMWS